jgi:hypothetical protein
MSFWTHRSNERNTTKETQHLRRGRKLGDSLGSLGNGVLGKLSRQHETDGSLNLLAAQSRLLANSGQTSSFGSDTIKDIVN